MQCGDTRCVGGNWRSRCRLGSGNGSESAVFFKYHWLISNLAEIPLENMIGGQRCGKVTEVLLTMPGGSAIRSSLPQQCLHAPLIEMAPVPDHHLGDLHDKLAHGASCGRHVDCFAFFKVPVELVQERKVRAATRLSWINPSW